MIRLICKPHHKNDFSVHSSCLTCFSTSETIPNKRLILYEENNEMIKEIMDIKSTSPRNRLALRRANKFLLNQDANENFKWWLWDSGSEDEVEAVDASVAPKPQAEQQPGRKGQESSQVAFKAKKRMLVDTDDDLSDEESVQTKADDKEGNDPIKSERDTQLPPKKSTKSELLKLPFPDEEHKSGKLLSLVYRKLFHV